MRPLSLKREVAEKHQMAEIFPFSAYRYNPERVQLEKVLTQPYDKITPAMQERYSGLSPNNLIAVEKGQTAPDDTPQNNVYTRAAQKLKDWLAQGIIVPDPAPAIIAKLRRSSRHLRTRASALLSTQAPMLCHRPNSDCCRRC